MVGASREQFSEDLFTSLQSNYVDDLSRDRILRRHAQKSLPMRAISSYSPRVVLEAKLDKLRTVRDVIINKSNMRDVARHKRNIRNAGVNKQNIRRLHT